MNLSTLRAALFITCKLLCGQWRVRRVFFFFLVAADNPDRLIQQLFLFTHGQHFFFPRKRKSASTGPIINLIYFPSEISPVWVTLQWRVWTRRWCQPPRDSDFCGGETGLESFTADVFSPHQPPPPVVVVGSCRCDFIPQPQGISKKKTQHIIVCTDNVSHGYFSFSLNILFGGWHE